jgi:hypothetical protein
VWRELEKEEGGGIRVPLTGHPFNPPGATSAHGLGQAVVADFRSWAGIGPGQRLVLWPMREKGPYQPVFLFF